MKKRERRWTPSRTFWGRSILPAVCALLTSGSVSAQEQPSSRPSVNLNGMTVAVRWSDGDSFRILEGEYSGRSGRLGGYNALESYGPVHRWGDWTPQDLYEIARQAGEFARTETWTCVTTGETDHYDRLLVNCDDLTLAMVSRGLGHLFAIDTPAQPDQIAAQAEAQRLGLGMWAKGVPASVVTSLHSATEGQERIYNRVISAADGSSTEVVHGETYEACQEVCLEEHGSCLIYVPFEQRYGDQRAACLRSGPH